APDVALVVDGRAAGADAVVAGAALIRGTALDHVAVAVDDRVQVARAVRLGARPAPAGPARERGVGVPAAGRVARASAAPGERVRVPGRAARGGLHDEAGDQEGAQGGGQTSHRRLRSEWPRINGGARGVYSRTIES